VAKWQCYYRLQQPLRALPKVITHDILSVLPLVENNTYEGISVDEQVVEKTMLDRFGAELFKQDFHFYTFSYGISHQKSFSKAIRTR